MTQTANEIEAVVARLEQDFVTQLEKAGHAELAKSYSDIIIMRRAQEIVEQNLTPVSHMQQLSSLEVPDEEPIFKLENEPSVTLADAVRDAVGHFKGRTFKLSDIWKVIQDRYPGVFPKKRKRSLSATLSQFANRGVIKREKRGEKGQPTLYSYGLEDNET